MSDLLLIVDDEPHILDPLIDYFESEGYRVISATDGEAALAAAQREPPDCVILDVMLPKLDGVGVCRALRKERPMLPIILLTAKGSEADRVLGLDSGADDYVTKPFGMLELHARVRSQLRRMRRVRATRERSGQVLFGACCLDLEKHALTRGGKALKVSAMELKLLTYLVSHEGTALPRQQLLNEVWGYERYPTTRTVDTHVWKLRQKIEDDPNAPRHIVTVHGVGYRFVSDPQDAG